MDLTAAIAGAQPAPYVIGPADYSYLYKGSARNLQERLRDHLAGRVSRTKNRRPLHLLYHRYCETYPLARQHEMYLKTGHGRAWLKTQL